MTIRLTAAFVLLVILALLAAAVPRVQAALGTAHRVTTPQTAVSAVTVGEPTAVPALYRPNGEEAQPVLATAVRIASGTTFVVYGLDVPSGSNVTVYALDEIQSNGSDTMLLGATKTTEGAFQAFPWPDTYVSIPPVLLFVALWIFTGALSFLLGAWVFMLVRGAVEFLRGRTDLGPDIDVLMQHGVSLDPVVGPAEWDRSFGQLGHRWASVHRLTTLTFGAAAAATGFTISLHFLINNPDTAHTGTWLVLSVIGLCLCPLLATFVSRRINCALARFLGRRRMSTLSLLRPVWTVVHPVGRRQRRRLESALTPGAFELVSMFARESSLSLEEAVVMAEALEANPLQVP